eukprot:gene8644-591_t
MKPFLGKKHQKKDDLGIDEFMGEYEYQHGKTYFLTLNLTETKKKLQTESVKSEIVTNDDTFSEFLGEFEEQDELDKTINHKQKSFSFRNLIHASQNPNNKKEIAVKDFPKYLKKYSLNHMLKYPKLRVYLKESSEKSFCAENVDFYEAIIDYKQLTTTEERMKKSEEIYHTFLELGSVSEVNLSEKQKREIHEKLNNPTKSLFNTVEFEIQNLIKAENYHRFIYSTEDFGRMLEEHEHVRIIGKKEQRYSK